MKRWAAFAILVAGIFLWHRPPAALPTPAASPMPDGAAPVAVTEGGMELESPSLVEPVAEVESETGKEEIVEEENRVRRRAIYDAMIERLIQSIDWTNADSRSRFPAEWAQLEAQFLGPDE